MAITAASTSALALLAAGDGPMPVHSIYPSGVNLRCGDYLIHASPRPHGGALSLGVTAGDLQRLGEQPAWEWTANALVAVDERTAIGLDEAAERYPTSPPASPTLSAATPGRLKRARAAAECASWFDSELGRNEGLPRLQAAIGALVGRHTGAAEPGAAECIRQVVGLGAGLTPSADDALVGALCLLKANGTVPAEVCEDLRGWLRADGVGATTDVSLSYLRLAFEGVFSVPVIRAVGSLTAGSAQAELEQSVRDLGDVGATSGMDTAVGIQIACELLTQPSHDSVFS